MIKKGNIVKLRNIPTYYNNTVLDWDVAIIVKGPYEDSITISDKPSVIILALVCDLLVDNKVWTSIPIDLLVRH